MINFTRCLAVHRDNQLVGILIKENINFSILLTHYKSTVADKREISIPERVDYLLIRSINIPYQNQI